jgi:hypothetical protein
MKEGIMPFVEVFTREKLSDEIRAKLAEELSDTIMTVEVGGPTESAKMIDNALTIVLLTVATDLADAIFTHPLLAEALNTLFGMFIRRSEFHTPQGREFEA